MQQDVVYDLERSNINLSLIKAKVNFQKLLDEISSLEITKENIEESRNRLKEFKKIKSVIDNLENPYYQGWKMWNDAKKSFQQPLDQVFSDKSDRLKKIAEEIEADKRRADAERKRVSDINGRISSFIMDYSIKVSNAASIDELVEYERLINLEATRKPVYQEFLEDFKTACLPLRDLIAKQKENVREISHIEKTEAKAEGEMNDELVMEMRQKREEIESRIADNQVYVQEKALEQVEKITAESPEVLAPTIKPSRTYWSYKVADPAEAMKKDPAILKIEINTKRAKEVLEQLKSSGEIGDKEEYTKDGIHYFIIKTY